MEKDLKIVFVIISFASACILSVYFIKMDNQPCFIIDFNIRQPVFRICDEVWIDCMLCYKYDKALL